jgi:hypothetical protein
VGVLGFQRFRDFDLVVLAKKKKKKGIEGLLRAMIAIVIWPRGIEYHQGEVLYCGE